LQTALDTPPAQVQTQAPAESPRLAAMRRLWDKKPASPPLRAHQRSTLGLPEKKD
jgi:hypothetical protein